MPKGKQPPKKRRALWLVGALLALLIALTGYMAIEASVVRLEYAEVALDQLPEAFDGTTILFVSDLHVDQINSPEKTSALIMKLQEVGADTLLLGGDYSSVGVMEFLRGERSEAYRKNMVDRFFGEIKDFYAPLGKFGVSGNHDFEVDGLKESMELGGVSLLRNQVVRIEKDGQYLYLVGLDDWKKGEQNPKAVAGQVRGSDCVIVLSHNPDALPTLNNQPASDGENFVDLMLSGHTHGGQIGSFSYRIIGGSAYKDRFLSGWYEENGARLLVSNGAGSLFVPLRLGAVPQAHFITLRCGKKK